MNQAHLEFLASQDWARMLESGLLPWIEIDDFELRFTARKPN